MPFFSKKKPSPFNLTPANRLASQSQATQQLQFPTESQLQSHLQSPQPTQQSQPLYPWSAHTPPSGLSRSPFPRFYHALSTTATAAGELLLFGGIVTSESNDLYKFSTRDFSTTLLKTSGQAPNPRCGHRAEFTRTILLVWGGTNSQNINDDSLYLLNLVSREWTSIVVNGPGPCGRYYHTMTLVGSKLFVFGGKNEGWRFNDIWAFDLNCLKSNPFWESYEPTPGNEKPRPRAGHVSVTTGDRIIIFGGFGDGLDFNDTWSFNISTRKWTELQCTGSIPSPRASHAAVLVDDVMYVFGGLARDETKLGDLTALNLSTQRWTAFQDIGPSPYGRYGHAMAADGTHVFLLGGQLSADAKANESRLIYVLDTKRIMYPDPDPNAVNPSEKATQLARESPVGLSTRGQPQQPTFSSSDSDVHAEHDTSPFQKATPGELDHPASLQIAREQNRGLNDLPSLLPGMNDKPRRVPEEGDNSEGSMEHHAKLVAPNASFEKEVARLEHERIADLEQRLSETQTERDRLLAQLTDQLAQKSALLEQAEANAAEAKKRAGLELRELQAKLGELMLSRNEHLRTLEQTQSALQKATSHAADADERSQPACEHETELAEVRAELEEKKSELEAVRLRLTDSENRAKSKAEADTSHAQTAAGLVNTDVDRFMNRLMERMRVMEAELASLRGNEKSIEEMECRNEG